MNKSLIGAVLASLTLVLWMASGQWHSGATAERVEQRAPAPPMQVQYQLISQQAVVREVVIQGHADPWRSLNLRVETAGRVESMLVEKGEPVRAGQTILRLAQDDRGAGVAEARARLSQLQAELDAALSLERSGLQARLRVEQARADLAAAQASLQRAEIELGHIEVQAPFAGILNQRMVEIGDYLDRAAIVATLIDNSRLRLRGEVPQQSIGGLATGRPGRIRFITGEERSGELIYISAAADPSTRSYTVELAVDNPRPALRSGMSAEIRIPLETVQAHFISPALLSLGEKGELGVKTLGAEDRVELHPVRIIRTSTAGIWVAGLAGQARVIVQGQGFVRPGDRVEAVAAPL